MTYILCRIVENFELTDFSGLCSDIEKVILVYEADCEEAANTLAAGKFTSLENGSSHFPKGCFLKKNGRIYWNSHDIGGRSSYGRAICFKSGKYSSLYCNLQIHIKFRLLSY